MGYLRAMAVAATLVAVAACSSTTGPSPSAISSVGELVETGFFHVVGDPPLTTRRLVFNYIVRDGTLSQASDSIAPGQDVVVDRATTPGPHRLVVNGHTCDGSFDVEAGMETDVVAGMHEDTCAIHVELVHPVDAATH